ncbi:amino acid adenylation domain-containing protein [Streptomyces sp. NA04227]|uniref:non-ribosomal peptide synthetase n=1 Tax=Streptomyces sp. NA04227 TaxID=2742136 RepID=UPI001590A3B1|nr:non-ribosomal peptide synthetase [Streptomyces sp. NA04227]QKW05281.1 amino acid adenylation domain-containing protein [Streptomyces sp. NA04227]
MADLDAQLAALSPKKRALFEKMMRERAAAEPTENVFPLSVMQQGIWFLEQIRPDNPAYLIPAAARIRGPLNIGALQDAVNEIVRRHESLRTRFELRDGVPKQVVRPTLDLHVPEEDVRGLGQDELDKRVAAELAVPFDLASGPLLRLKLLRTGAEEWVLLVAMHHLVSDGWSVKVLFTELSALYQAFAAGRTSPLSAPRIQYGDFAAWQQGLDAESLREDLAYWRGHLAGAPSVLALRSDRPRPAVQGFNGGSVPFELPASLHGELTALAASHGATAYMALLAAFNVVLHRYSGQSDVVVGVPTAGRGRADVEPLIGFFVNTLPVRTDLSGEPDFLGVLARVREGCLGLYAHENVPFEKIVEDLGTERDLSRPPVFQVALSYQSDPLPTLALAGVEFQRLDLRADGARFDLELQFFERDGAVTGWFEYDRDLFDESTMARMARHLRRVIELAVAAPGTPVGALDLLDEAERHEVLAAGTAEEREWPGAGLIHQCFEARAASGPDAEALRFEGESLTYGELNARANQLAHKLRGMGVGPDVLVGVCLERSVELVVGLLAVLKAGGAYVPLDPGYPTARLTYMLDDAKVPVLLTQRHVLQALPPVGATTLCVEELRAELAGEPATDPGVELDGDNLAYVIYTSGSTGAPKGVMNVHTAIRNRLLWMQDAYGLQPGERVLQKTPFSFDVSVWEFFWPLMCGATLVVARPEGHKDGRYLLDVIRQEAISTLHFVPSMLQVFLEQDGVESCTGLRRVICSGEALPRALQERFFERSTAELHNLYGPTEAAVDVSFWECRRDGDPRPVPIGRPVTGTRLYVLDASGRPTPVGVPGELHIGGCQLARGYLGREELTAERFVADPFAPGPNARMYRTGDLACFREDGAIEYLGRLDHQVKLRGFRIELGEIESALRDRDGVREAVVLAREIGGDTRLVAYLTGDAVPSAAELGARLKEHLPEFMVPSAFVTLPSLPLTPNGKTDRAALPDPEPVAAVRAVYAAPEEGLEHSLAALWREVLGVERVGRDDNFFELGGNSLLMARLQARLTAAHQLDVPMVELFQNPTVGSLAAHLGRSDAAPDSSPDGRERAATRRSALEQRRSAAARRNRSRNGR